MPLVTPPMHPVGPGVYHPAYSTEADGGARPVPAFLLDETPVTNAAYLVFVTERPSWRRGVVAPAFADAGYLAAWASPTAFGPGVAAEAPVTGVSWFAARAYCEARGAALPTTAQWEVAASASATAADARTDAAFNQSVLDWYARPATERPGPVGRSAPNIWGIRDLHGLLWEWTEDFNGDLVGPDGVCGAGALGATDAGLYPAVARAQMRASLRGAYTMTNLGFRCARPTAP